MPFNIITTEGAPRVIALAAGPQGIPARQDIVVFVRGALASSDLLLRLVSAGAATFTAANSFAGAETASTGLAEIQVTRNGAAFATITFDASATGLVAFSGDASVQAGDILRFIAPAIADATLADISITLAGA